MHPGHGWCSPPRGFLNTVVTTAAQVTSYLVEDGTQVQLDRFTRQLTGAAPPARRAADASPPGADLGIPKLLLTGTYLRMAFVSRVTR